MSKKELKKLIERRLQKAGFTLEEKLDKARGKPHIKPFTNEEIDKAVKDLYPVFCAEEYIRQDNQSNLLDSSPEIYGTITLEPGQVFDFNLEDQTVGLRFPDHPVVPNYNLASQIHDFFYENDIKPGIYVTPTEINVARMTNKGLQTLCSVNPPVWSLVIDDKHKPINFESQAYADQAIRNLQ